MINILTLSKSRAPNLLDVLKSVLMSFLGVQSDEVRKRDFEHGKPSHFIIVGLILTLVFIISVFGIVKLVLYFSLN